MRLFAIALGLVVGCGGNGGGGGGGDGGGGGEGGGGEVRRLGPDQSGQYHLGPVEWSGSFNNGCSPYASDVQSVEGAFLAGVANELGADPRAMTWHLVTCPGSDPVYLQFQTGANIWWTSFWVRNPRVVVKRVEVKSANHASWFALRHERDGTWNDDGGFGAGQFSLRLTGIDDSTVEITQPSFAPGALVRTTTNF